MNGLVGHLGLAVLTFAVTNVDDLLLLGLFFSNSRYPTRSVVAGQFLGVAFLVGVSLVGLVLGKYGQPQWIGWLGLVPFFIGLRAAWRLRSASVVEAAPQRASTGSTVLQVAAITIANGADNISVYVPLFATLPAAVVSLYCGVFAAMVGVWCLASYFLVQHPGLSRVLTRYGHLILPFFLMALGGWILFETKAYTLAAALTVSQRSDVIGAWPPACRAPSCSPGRDAATARNEKRPAAGPGVQLHKKSAQCGVLLNK